VGVDFGATNLRAGVCARDGRLLSLIRRPTNLGEGIDAVVGRIVEIAERAVAESKLNRQIVTGVAIGCCGLVNRELGLLICSSVLPGWRNVPLGDRVAASIDLPVFLTNDANAAIFGEWFAGTARGLKHVVGMTLGTGIGGAAILNANLYEGAAGLSGEFGHLTVDPDGPPCYCGNRGCLGLLAGGEGIARRYKEGAERHGNDAGGNVDATEVFSMAQQGDELAQRVVAETARYLGIGVGSLLSCFNPEMVVFTGGITRAGDPLLKAIREEASRRTYRPVFDAARIEFGSLGDAAGVVGSAGILFDARADAGP
jgi:glucokinase